jgi:hypothetical protein
MEQDSHLAFEDKVSGEVIMRMRGVVAVAVTSPCVS